MFPQCCNEKIISILKNSRNAEIKVYGVINIQSFSCAVFFYQNAQCLSNVNKLLLYALLMVKLENYYHFGTYIQP